MNFVAKPLLNITEAFENLDRDQAVEVDYAIGSVRNVKHKIEKVSNKRFKVITSRLTKKACIVRIH